MARSGKRGVMDHNCLKRFRRRRLLAFLRRNNLPATFDALKRETRVLLDLPFLQRLVVDGRWQEAREYIIGFPPCWDNQILVRFIARFNVLEDLAQGELGGYGAAEDLESQLEAIPSTMSDPHFTEAVRKVFYMGSHPAYWGPVDWHLIRLKASQVVKDLVTQTPEFRHLLRLPRCPSNPCHTIPFGFGGCRRHKRKNIGRMPASLLARRFLQQERRPSLTCTRGLSVSGLSCEPMNLEEIIDETLLAGKQEVREHSDSCTEGSPVELFIGKSFGIAPANADTKHLSPECYTETTSGAKLKPTTGEFCPDVVDAPSGGGMDPKDVFNKINAITDISDDMASLLIRTSTLGPEYKMLLGKIMEQWKLLYELRMDCRKAQKFGCTSIVNFST